MFWGCLERDFGRASGTPDVEPEDGDVEVFFSRVFLASVELAPFVDVFAAGVAAHGEWGHEADGLLLRASGLGAFVAGDFGGVELGGVAGSRG